MDQYDPGKKIGMSIDEWGTWYLVEPGTNPGFLYQQNTMRDALVAGISLNIFNKHCDRVKIACIAQMVNVLQSVILTEGEKMVKTPTWYVFKMFRDHQGAELLESSISGSGMTGVQDDRMVPEITESVSEKDGVITITINNLSMTEDKELSVQFAQDKKYEVVEANILKSTDPQDFNDFDAPDKVRAEEYKSYKADGRGFKLTLPKASVVELRVR